MAIPLGYSRNVIHGTLEGGEIFEWGFWIAAAPTDAAAASAQASAIATAYTSAVATGSPAHALMSTGDAITEVRVYSYPTGGPNATYVGTAPLSEAGSGTSTCPNQVAVCVTLETGLAGRRNRGRVYLPATHPGTLVAGQLGSATVTAVALFMQKFLQNVNSGVGQPVVVLSQVASLANDVTVVRIDSRLDIQRRRANRQPATFTQLETL